MEKLAQLGTDESEFLVGQFPDLPSQTGDRYRLELLKMEHPGLEKRLGVGTSQRLFRTAVV